MSWQNMYCSILPSALQSNLYIHLCLTRSLFVTCKLDQNNECLYEIKISGWRKVCYERMSAEKIDKTIHWCHKNPSKTYWCDSLGRKQKETFIWRLKLPVSKRVLRLGISDERMAKKTVWYAITVQTVFYINLLCQPVPWYHISRAILCSMKIYTHKENCNTERNRSEGGRALKKTHVMKVNKGKNNKGKIRACFQQTDFLGGGGGEEGRREGKNIFPATRVGCFQKG